MVYAAHAWQALSALIQQPAHMNAPPSGALDNPFLKFTSFPCAVSCRSGSDVSVSAGRFSNTTTNPHPVPMISWAVGLSRAFVALAATSVPILTYTRQSIRCSAPPLTPLLAGIPTAATSFPREALRDGKTIW
ncbi:hypothetical protein BS50DRAFT_57147 [Corynespora cassiicola Philippines]|uniref:Uncharacterized protein n=1 Tax=Corynespora cassiicola Philippines TaxID=1448308 RepID=A0A2T2NIX7_CORCC|nr:hypothetical protein BS50DRAFT_57147 [Corynespora cassiicola Philippines]